MKNIRSIFHVFLSLCLGLSLTQAQEVSKADLQFFTAEWKGERLPDGRPKVSDDILKLSSGISVPSVVNNLM